MKRFLFSTLAIILPTLSYSLTPGEALARLMQGNDRYVHDKLEHPDRTSDRREAVQNSQKPFAIILGCSDSRVSPEIIFDQGIGDLFVVRVAGNIVSPVVLDSIEYSAKYLGSSLIVVLGHEKCGAVDAVMQGKTQDIEAIAKEILPAIESCKSQQNPLTNCIKANVLSVVQQIEKYPSLSKLIAQRQVNVIGAYYSLTTGKVELLPIKTGQ